MTKTRLEAFSDGVIAIIITIMVLEMKVPHVAEFGALQPLTSNFAAHPALKGFAGLFAAGEAGVVHAVASRDAVGIVACLTFHQVVAGGEDLLVALDDDGAHGVVIDRSHQRIGQGGEIVLVHQTARLVQARR